MHFDRQRENERLDRHESANAAKIAELEQTLRASGCPDHALDELVHDAAANIEPAHADEASRWASEAINNQGFSRQIAFVLQENGLHDGRRLIEEAAAEAKAESSPSI